MQTKIQHILKSNTLNYSEVAVAHFWLKRKQPEKIAPQNVLSEMLYTLTSENNSLICIQTEQLTDTKLIEALFEAAKRNRIYILLNEKNEAVETLKGACLIRYDLKNIGSFVLINPNKLGGKGFFFNGQLTAQSLYFPQNIGLDLGNPQITGLFQHFCYHFWNTAKYELLENAQKVANSSVEAFPCKDNFCEANFVKTSLQETFYLHEISIPIIENTSIIKLDTLKNAKIITYFKQNNIDLLNKIVSNNNQIFGLSTINPFHLIGNWLVPAIYVANDALFWAFPLNSAQKKLVNAHFSAVENAADYQYFGEETRGELLNETLIFPEKISTEIVITGTETLTAKNCSAQELLSKVDFETQEPDFEDNGKSIEITFTWQNIPFYLPKTAKTHKLYSLWTEFEGKVKAFIQKIENNIKEAEAQESSILPVLKRFFLGKKTLFSDIKMQLNRLKDKPFSALPAAEMKEIIKKLNALNSQILGEKKEIIQENKKAKLQQEIEELTAQKAEKEEALKAFILEKETEKAEKEAKLALFCEKNEISKENLRKFQGDREQKAGKKNQEKNPEEAAQAKEVLQELKNLQSFDFAEKIKTDITKKEKEMEQIQREIHKKEKEKGQNIPEKEAEKSSLNEILGKKEAIVSPLETDLQNPNLGPLPHTGKLYELGNQAYIAIEYWEEYEQGKVEALRFSAKLCANNS